MPTVQPKYFVACPVCGNKDVMIPLGVDRENLQYYTVPGEPFVAFNVAPCAGCGVMRVFRHLSPNYRDEPSVGEQRQPPPPPPPPLVEQRCPECKGEVEYPQQGEINMPGLWAVCRKCERAYTVEIGEGDKVEVTKRMSLGIAKPKEDKPSKPSRQQRRKAQRDAAKGRVGGPKPRRDRSLGKGGNGKEPDK